MREAGVWNEKKLGGITRKVKTDYNSNTCIETGTFVYQTPNSVETEEFYVRHYAPGEMEDLLSENGYKILSAKGTFYECGK